MFGNGLPVGKMVTSDEKNPGELKQDIQQTFSFINNHFSEVFTSAYID